MCNTTVHGKNYNNDKYYYINNFINYYHSIDKALGKLQYQSYD